MEKGELERIQKQLNDVQREIREIKEMLKQLSLFHLNPEQYCSGGGEHEYPNPWFGTIPPSCKKCGKQGSFSNITYITMPNGKSSDAAGYDFSKFGGNLMGNVNIPTNQLSLDFNNTGISTYIKPC